MKSWMGAEPGQGFRVVTLICCRGRRGPEASPRLFGDATVVARGQLRALSRTSEDPHARPPPGKWERGQGGDSQLLLP